MYRLQQPAAEDGTQQSPVKIECADTNPGHTNRLCYVSWSEYEGWRAEYHFWPKDGVPNTYSRHDTLLGPSEPDEFVAFDGRLRKWIDDLQKKPSP